MGGRIVSVSGSVIIADDLENAKMNDIILVGDNGLIGEIIKMDGSRAIAQVYEDTSGLRLGEKVINTGNPLSVELAPGLIGSIFDGVQRPLDLITKKEGVFIKSGIKMNAIDYNISVRPFRKLMRDDCFSRSKWSGDCS